MSRIDPSGSEEFCNPASGGIWVDPVAVKQRFTQSLRYLLPILFVFCLAEISFAAMTIYLKDGGSRRVHKIVFQGEKAELYLLDGQVITLSVNQIDLPSSGIGAPVGTYGQTRVGPTRKVGNTSKSLGMDQEERQADLQEEWDKSNRIVIATRDIGTIKKGDRVKIVGESSEPISRTSTKKSYGDTTYRKRTYSDTSYYRYQEPENPDQAYVILYKNPDGTFSKKLFDAATFSANFKFPEPPKQTSSRPIVPQLPPDPDREADASDPVLTLPEPAISEEESAKPISRTRPPVQKKEEPSIRSEPVSEPVPAERRAPLYAGLLILLAAGAIGFLVWRGRNKPFLDTSKFAQYEEDLREFEIAIWLRNGKTEDQLKEICLKKFFQDSPAALSIAMKMLKGGERSWLIPYIIKQSGTGMEEADQIYRQIGERLDRIQSLIREVSGRTGILPQKQVPVVAVDVTQKTMKSVPHVAPVVSSPAPEPSSFREEPVPAGPSPAPAEQAVPVSNPPGSWTSSLAIPGISPDGRGRSATMRPQSGTGDVPAYISNVLNQLGFLSDSDEDISR